MPTLLHDPLASRAVRSLVARARDGDREAYDQLFAQSAERLLLYVRLRLGPRLRRELDSQDVLQESYLAAHKAFPRFECRDENAFARWLCAIAENQIRGWADHQGAAKRRRADGPSVTTALKRVASTKTGPITQADRSDTRARLEVALESLDEDARQLLLWRYFQGRTLSEIARLADEPQTTVRRRIGEAQLALGRALRVKEGA